MNLYSKEKSHLSSLHLCMTPEMALSSLCYMQIFSFCLPSLRRSAFEVLLSPATAASETKAPPLPTPHCPADRKSMPNNDAEIPQTTLSATQQESVAGLSSPEPILTAIESLSYPFSGRHIRPGPLCSEQLLLTVFHCLSIKPKRPGALLQRPARNCLLGAAGANLPSRFTG